MLCKYSAGNLFRRRGGHFTHLSILHIFTFVFDFPPLAAALDAGGGSIFKEQPKCKPIDLAVCRNMPYNLTIFPTPFFDDELSLETQAEDYKIFFNTNCNQHVQFFVCSALVPMCPEQFPQALSSCRSLCEEVKHDCLDILQKIGLSWPETLDCGRFVPDSTKMCMNPPAAPMNLASNVVPGARALLEAEDYDRLQPNCPEDTIDLNPLNKGGKCAFRCDRTTMFTKDKKDAARAWIFLWSVINVIVTTFTSLTFIINRQRFHFPERSILHIAICYLCYSIPYLIRSLLTFEQSACSRTATGQKFLVQSSGQDNTVCVMFSLVTYFFGMAGLFWWLMLTFTWYLSAARKWVVEEIEKRVCYLHTFAWGVPFALSVVALVSHKIDASELTGVCSVGNSEPWTLLWFVIVPRSAVLFVGFCLIVAGFSSMCQERKAFRRRGMDTSNLKKFMLKMGSFSTLYIGLAVVGLFCECYQFLVLRQWYPAVVGCKLLGGGVHTGHCTRPDHPKSEYYVLNVTVWLAVGLATAMWTVSSKTWYSWRDALCCCFGCAATSPTVKKKQQLLLLQQCGGSGMDDPTSAATAARLPHLTASSSASQQYQHQLVLTAAGAMRQPLLVPQPQQVQYQPNFMPSTGGGGGGSGIGGGSNSGGMLYQTQKTSNGTAAASSSLPPHLPPPPPPPPGTELAADYGSSSSNGGGGHYYQSQPHHYHHPHYHQQSTTMQSTAVGISVSNTGNGGAGGAPCYVLTSATSMSGGASKNNML